MLFFTGSRIRYAITDGNEQGLFKINGQNGEVQLVQPLDRETKNQVSKKICYFPGNT